MIPDLFHPKYNIKATINASNTVVKVEDNLNHKATINRRRFIASTALWTV